MMPALIPVGHNAFFTFFPGAGSCKHGNFLPLMALYLPVKPNLLTYCVQSIDTLQHRIVIECYFGALLNQTRINLTQPIAAIVSMRRHGYNPLHKSSDGLLTDFCPGNLAEQAQTFLARIAELLSRDMTSADPQTLPRPKMTSN